MQVVLRRLQRDLGLLDGRIRDVVGDGLVEVELRGPDGELGVGAVLRAEGGRIGQIVQASLRLIEGNLRRGEVRRGWIE